MINERIMELINVISNGNKRAFSRLVEVNPTVIENIVGTRKGKPGYDLLEKISFAIENINTDWLLTGRGAMLHYNQEESTSYPIAQPDLSGEASFYCRMYEKEKAEKESKIEEIGALKLKISQLEVGKARRKKTAKNVSTEKISSQKAENVSSVNAQLRKQ